MLLPEEEEDGVGGGGANYEKAVQLMTVGSSHSHIDVAHQCLKLTVHFSLLQAKDRWLQKQAVSRYEERMLKNLLAEGFYVLQQRR